MSSVFFKSVLSLALLAGLTGCKSLLSNPSPMPTGYAHHRGETNTPPPAPADSLGYDYSEEKNAEILSIWRPKVEELVDRLEQEAGLSHENMYIRVPLNTDPQMATFDYILRDVLRMRGHTIISDRYAGLILTYNIIDPDVLEHEKRRDVYAHNESTGLQDPPYTHGGTYKPMLLELALFDKTMPVTAISAVYNVPMYGYEPYDIPFMEPIAGRKVPHWQQPTAGRINE